MSCLCGPSIDIIKIFEPEHRFNGKCKRCKTPLSILAKRASLKVDVTNEPLVGGRWKPSGFENGYVDDQGRIWRQNFNMTGPSVTCPSCGGKVSLAQVDGSFKAGKVCDARCMNSTGHVCECSCRGANHGAGHGF